MSFDLPLPPQNDPVTARQKIDEEIAQLQAKIIALKNFRNTFTPFSRLHPEVMQEIFVLASRESKYRAVGKTSLLISWVCHHWRVLAQQTSALWSYIDFVEPTWVEAALSRTHNRSLQFSIFCPSERIGQSTPFIPLCLGNLSRISSLSLGADSDTELHRAASSSLLWTTPAPILVALELSGMFLPSQLFSGICPILQRLSLTSCDFHWESLPIHDGLQRLEVTQPVTRTSVDGLMHRLQIAGQHLESISLDNVLLPIITTPNLIHHLPHIRQAFPKITCFSLDEDHLPSATVFLNRISLPHTADYISIGMGNNPEEQLDTVRAFVASRGIEKWSITSLDLELQDDYVHINMTENRNPDNVHVGQHGDRNDGNGDGGQHADQVVNLSKTRTISLHIDTSDDSDVRDVIPIFDILPFFPFKTLTFNGSHTPNHISALTEYLDAKGAIEELNVIEFSVWTFTSILMEQIKRIERIPGWNDPSACRIGSKIRDECRNIIGFHQLKTLSYYGDNSDRYPFDVIYFEILYKWLRSRKRVGLEVERLTFERMNISSESYLMELYEGSVGEIECIEVEEMPDEVGVEEFRVNFDA
ncbi:hypothetical protein BDN72DRAFT_960946 [Pluteus cervinus]|uniref:Uncharacterized protein n=1 Tax=Pluteus cervinus TaxID=181527 RepID=A0ACD3APD6_9AGAR|nr:hypothetical protein BDN72DRAFT_960946 [Pluteus cervinus]